MALPDFHSQLISKSGVTCTRCGACLRSRPLFLVSCLLRPPHKFCTLFPSLLPVLYPSKKKKRSFISDLLRRPEPQFAFHPTRNSVSCHLINMADILHMDDAPEDVREISDLPFLKKYLEYLCDRWTPVNTDLKRVFKFEDSSSANLPIFVTVKQWLEGGCPQSEFVLTTVCIDASKSLGNTNIAFTSPDLETKLLLLTFESYRPSRRRSDAAQGNSLAG